MCQIYVDDNNAVGMSFEYLIFHVNKIYSKVQALEKMCDSNLI